jgi:hypothetical protein
MRHATNIRFTPIDLAIIARLREKTGGTTSSVLRLAIRALLEEHERRDGFRASQRTGT